MDLDRLAPLFVDGPMPLVRTDFSDDPAWSRVVDEVSRDPEESYTPNLEPISDVAFEAVTPEQLASAWPRERHGYVILADQRSMAEAQGDGEITVVLVDLYASEEDEEEFGEVFGHAFRSQSGEVASIEANLSLANMDFSEFAGSVDEDGVFRGF